MSNLNGFKFFDFSSVDLISNVLSNPNKGNSVTIEVQDDNSASPIGLIVEAKTDIKGGENAGKWQVLSSVSLQDFSVQEEITKQGIYCVPLTGISWCRIRSTKPLGHIKVFGIVTD